MTDAVKISPWTETRLAELDTHGDYRLRGRAMTRLETFIDAAFAFAVTMLVISVDDIPRSYDEFSETLRSIPAFIASFFQVMMFWLGLLRILGHGQCLQVLLDFMVGWQPVVLARSSTPTCTRC